MGNVFQVPWTVLPGGSYWPEQGIAALQELGFYTVAMALKEDSVPMDDPSLKTHEKLAILLGTEGDGLASDTIAETDATVLIPMTHGVDSLTSLRRALSHSGSWREEDKDVPSVPEITE